MKTKVSTIEQQLKNNEQTYLQLHNQIEFLNKQCNEIKREIIASMQKLGIEETDKLSLIIQTNTEFNIDVLREILSPQKFNKIKAETVDRKAYQAAIKLKLLDQDELIETGAVKVSITEYLRKKSV